jgi:hypothetical protein
MGALGGLTTGILLDFLRLASLGFLLATFLLFTSSFSPL